MAETIVTRPATTSPNLIGARSMLIFAVLAAVALTVVAVLRWRLSRPMTAYDVQCSRTDVALDAEAVARTAEVAKVAYAEKVA